MQSRKPVVILVLLLVVGIIVGGAIMTGGSARVIAPAAILAVIVIIATLIVKAKGDKQRRREAAGNAAARLGLTRPEVSKTRIKAYRHLPEVPRSATMAEAFEGEVDGRRLLVFESRYMVHTGQAPVPVIFSVYASEAPAWPDVAITPRHALSRVARSVGIGKGLELESANFNNAFKVNAADEDFAIMLLGPEMQTFMLEKTNARWRIGKSMACLVYSGQLKFDRMDASLDRMARFWSHVPAELEAWR